MGDGARSQHKMATAEVCGGVWGGEERSEPSCVPPRHGQARGPERCACAGPRGETLSCPGPGRLPGVRASMRAIKGGREGRAASRHKRPSAGAASASRWLPPVGLRLASFPASSAAGPPGPSCCELPCVSCAGSRRLWTQSPSSGFGRGRSMTNQDLWYSGKLCLTLLRSSFL